MRKLKLAIIQMQMGDYHDENVDHAEAFVREAAAQGANLVLLPELFAHRYFCKDQDAKFFDWAKPTARHPLLKRFSALARELSVVLPISFFEKFGPTYFNSVAVLDADASMRHVYRKAHIPDGPGYQEKFYFTPGNTAFEPVETAVGRIGVLICWDQWFPEPARLLALRGAEVLLYPSAIGTEPPSPELDSSGHWRRVMQGHAGANVIPVAAANRVGEEQGRDTTVIFYGTSFIADHTGAVIKDANRTEQAILHAQFDLDILAATRRDWGVFRDRRPELYGGLTTHDGRE